MYNWKKYGFIILITNENIWFKLKTINVEEDLEYIKYIENICKKCVINAVKWEII